MSPVDNPGAIRRRLRGEATASTKSKSKKAQDSCLIALGEIWPAILRSQEADSPIPSVSRRRTHERNAMTNLEQIAARRAQRVGATHLRGRPGHDSPRYRNVDRVHRRTRRRDEEQAGQPAGRRVAGDQWAIETHRDGAFFIRVNLRPFAVEMNRFD